MRSGNVCTAAADRRLSGASVGGGGGGGAATGPASQGREAAASPQQLAAELAAEQALEEAQRDEIPHLSLQVSLQVSGMTFDLPSALKSSLLPATQHLAPQTPLQYAKVSEGAYTQARAANATCSVLASHMRLVTSPERSWLRPACLIATISASPLLDHAVDTLGAGGGEQQAAAAVAAAVAAVSTAAGPGTQH